MPGDRETCLAAGMDDYLGKTIRQEELSAVLERWLPRNLETTTWDIFKSDAALHEAGRTQCDNSKGELTPTTSQYVIRPNNVPSCSLNTARVQEWEELGWTDFVRRMIDQFVLDVTSCVRTIETALDHENTQALAEAAHGLKWVSANIGATPPFSSLLRASNSPCAKAFFLKVNKSWRIYKLNSTTSPRN